MKLPWAKSRGTNGPDFAAALITGVRYPYGNLGFQKRQKWHNN